MKTFSQLSKAQQRVAVAKDVIKTIQGNRVRLVQGKFVTFPQNLGDSIPHSTLTDGCSLKKLVSQFPCQACAIGMAFISIANHGRYHVSPHELITREINWNNLLKKVNRVFGEDTSHIEYCFENGDGYYSDSDFFDRSLRAKLRRYSSRLPKTPEKRLVTIMENVIQNKGAFVI